MALGRVGAQAEEEDFAGAFPILDEAQTAKLGRYGVEESVPAGHVFFREGERGSDFVLVLTGTVERLESFGVFVRLGPGQTGLIPIAELGLARGTDLRKAFPVGTEIKVLVLTIEEGGRRIRLSHAQALGREERAETQAYLRETTKQGDGFRLTLGERMKQAPRNRS